MATYECRRPDSLPLDLTVRPRCEQSAGLITGQLRVEITAIPIQTLSCRFGNAKCSQTGEVLRQANAARAVRSVFEVHAAVRFNSGLKLRPDFIGKVHERNACRSPWINTFDFRLNLGLPVRRTMPLCDRRLPQRGAAVPRGRARAQGRVHSL